MKEFRKILKYARPYTKSLVFAFIFLALTSLINLILPLIVRNMINAVIVLKDSEVLDGLAWDLIVIIGLQAVFAVTHNYIFGFVGHRMTTDFRIEFFSHIQSLSLRFFQERRVGEILSRMSSDISVIENALVTIPVALLRQSITLAWSDDHHSVFKLEINRSHFNHLTPFNDFCTGFWAAFKNVFCESFRINWRRRWWFLKK